MARTVVPLPRTSSEEGTGPRVVVGADGSVASVRALLWALELVGAYGGSVEVVTAWPLHAPVFIGEVPGHFNDARWQAVQAQNRVLQHARELLGGDGPAVTRTLRNDGPLDAILDAAAHAELVVVGARREAPSDPATGATLAEVLQVAAPCPVLEVSSLGVLSLPWGQHAFGPAATVARLRRTSSPEPAPA